MPEIDFFIPMTPVPKARARVTRTGHAYTPKRTMQAEEFIRIAAAKHAPREPIQGPIILDLFFVMPIPKSAKHIKAGDYHTKRPDRDNLEKLVQDALKNWWGDDAQVADGRICKKYGHEPGVQVRVQWWE